MTSAYGSPRETLEENVFHELRQMRRWFAIFACEHNECARKPVFPWDALDGAAARKGGESPLRDKCNAHAESDKVNDDIETIELHGGFDIELLLRHPCGDLSGGLRVRLQT